MQKVSEKVGEVKAKEVLTRTHPNGLSLENILFQFFRQKGAAVDLKLLKLAYSALLPF
ncbi:hypothetical protein [Syntrophomonas wolfei]|uniref:hypothetical protein n=1 Tax=Syntrophomonas wolfei TaxID=863 RepID=UPI001F617603|nr:hypothetical protein [Syntrophomonas wolfei]